MTSWWSSASEPTGSAPKQITRESYVPTPLETTSLPSPHLDSLTERARLQYRMWEEDLTSQDITPLHLACMLANVNTLHTLLCAGLYCPKKTMVMKGSDYVNPVFLMSSQPDDQSANMCLKMFLNALDACENMAVEPVGPYKYVACKQCFKKLEAKPAPPPKQSKKPGQAPAAVSQSEPESAHAQNATATHQ